MLAPLNHSHIAAIYGFEEAAGVQALVLELVEGPTLADRIAQGSIPWEEALAIAAQIAEALEGAHARGIVHRDLKPANIKVRADVLAAGWHGAILRESENNSLYAVAVKPGPKFAFDPPKLLFELRANVMLVRNSYIPTRDGQRILVNMALDSTTPPIRVVRNWTAGLKD